MPPATMVLPVPASVRPLEAMNGMSSSLQRRGSAARSQTCAFLDLSRCYCPGKRVAQLSGRLQCELHCDPRTGPERGVHKIYRNGLFQERVVRVVVGHHRMGQIEPPVTALAGAVGADDLDNRGAHLG